MKSRRIGLVGSGMIGSTLARLWTRASHEVLVSSRHPDKLAPLVVELGARARTGSPEEAARFGDVVVLTTPLGAVPRLAESLGDLLEGKIVIDTNNPYENRDGELAEEAVRGGQGSGVWVQRHFPGARVVKAFNTVYFQTLLAEAHRDGARVGIPLASDDAEAMHQVADLVRDAGFDPVEVGAMERSREFDVGTPVYNTGASGEEVRHALGLS